MTETSSESDAIYNALEAVAADISRDGLRTEIFTDDSEMTPMLVVEFERYGNRADVLRTLFGAEGPVVVDSVHRDKAVVRGK